MFSKMTDELKILKSQIMGALCSFPSKKCFLGPLFFLSCYKITLLDKVRIPKTQPKPQTCSLLSFLFLAGMGIEIPPETAFRKERF